MKPTIPDVLPLVQELYRRSCVGCCLHIVLDDGNLEDSSVKFCLGYAIEQGHQECMYLATMLLAMSRTQRSKLYRHAGKRT